MSDLLTHEERRVLRGLLERDAEAAPPPRPDAAPEVTFRPTEEEGAGHAAPLPGVGSVVGLLLVAVACALALFAVTQ